MKKIFAILLTLVMVISMFAGCDSSHDHPPTTEPTEVITAPTIDETEAPVETTVTETDAPMEAETEDPTEAPTEAPTEPVATECKHNYTSKVTTVATCTTDGVKTYTCENCGHSYTERIAAKHDYECTDTRPATCSNTGDKTYTCSNCGHSYKETLPKNEHKWGDWVVTKEPTTTTYGQKVRECELCHGAQYANIDPLPADDTEPVHQHSYNSEVTKAATCTEDGVKTFSCSCGASYTETITKTGHSWGNWKVTKEATTEAEGEETRACGNCGKTETRKTDKLPANNDDEIVDCESLGKAHKMSAADHAKITKGNSFYEISCICGRGCRGSNRDAAMANFNKHVAEGLYDYCGEIRWEREGHYHNIPNITVVCIECGKSTTCGNCYLNCRGDGLECCYG